MDQEKSLANLVLASLISSYPESEFQEHLSTLLSDELLDIPSELRQKLVSLSSSENLVNELRSSYIEIFDHSKSLNPLYETEYGRERSMFKANELADIAAFYRAFGFELDSEGQKEMLDHVSVELEFYSLMKMKLAHLQQIGDKEGVEIVTDGMQKFLKDHLGRFPSAIATRQGVMANEFFAVAFEWINKLVESECLRFGVKPEAVKWLASDNNEDSICCGGSVSINK